MGRAIESQSPAMSARRLGTWAFCTCYRKARPLESELLEERFLIETRTYNNAIHREGFPWRGRDVLCSIDLVAPRDVIAMPV